MSKVARAVALAAIVMGLTTWSWAGPPSRTGHVSMAKAGVCETCGKTIVAKAEVTVREHAGGRTHHYRCINCALLASRDWLKGDVTVRAHSALRGDALTWTRTAGKWQATPSTARVLDLPETKGDSATIHLPFANAGEYQAYAAKHADAAGHQLISAASVARILEAGRPPLPKVATCPVSGETVHPTDKTDWTMHAGHVYYFCCANCKPRFTSNPVGYLSGKEPKPNKAGACGDHAGGGCGAAGGSCAGESGKKGGVRASRPATTTKAKRA